jgi:hypothetical protein
MRYFLLPVLVVFVFSCSTKERRKAPSAEPIVAEPQKIDTVAYFEDSLNIGTPKRNKLWFSRIMVNDTLAKAQVQLYSKQNNSWGLKYSFEDEYWSAAEMDATVADFNNDGYKDFIYLTGTGARGGNVIYNLFIYDIKGDSLAYVVNANDYPNLSYNKETNSINAFILTGGIETVFLRLDGNKLKPFASIFQYGKVITVTEYDNEGASKVIQVDTSNRFEDFSRFTNYKPLKAEE